LTLIDKLTCFWPKQPTWQEVAGTKSGSQASNPDY